MSLEREDSDAMYLWWWKPMTLPGDGWHYQYLATQAACAALMFDAFARRLPMDRAGLKLVCRGRADKAVDRLDVKT